MEHDRTSAPAAGLARFEDIGLGLKAGLGEVPHAPAHDVTNDLFFDDVNNWRTPSFSVERS